MKKIVLAAMLVGFVIALVLGATWLYMHNQNLPKAGAVLILWKITFWIWPTVITMGPDAEGSFGIVLLFISAILNALVYGTIAFAIAFVWKRVSRKVAQR